MSAPVYLTGAEFFAGIGLVRVALEEAGVQVTWANDIEPCKRAVYVENFNGEDFLLADVRSVNGADVPTVDLATASFPCTDLSLAGNRGGIRAGGSSMFWEFARVLDEMGDRAPQVILLENVPGFATSRNGRDLRDALLRLNELGYSCDLFAVNATHFVPQSRLRMFIVGSRFPTGERVATEPDAVRPQWIIDFMRKHGEIDFHGRSLRLPDPGSAGLDGVVDRFPRTSSIWWEPERVTRFVDSLSALQLERLDALRYGRTLTWRTAYRRTRGGVAVWEMRPDSLAGCLRTARGGSSKQAVVEAGRGNVRVRWMTATEYAALQGAPDYSFSSVSENKALFGFGDAVCVPVISWIANQYLVPLFADQAETAAYVAAKDPPEEVTLVRTAIRTFFDQTDDAGEKIGRSRCGVYAFFDYDGEPIYVGQTIEGLSGRVSRHLTGRRSDAVGKFVLDPFEVLEIEVWPLKDAAAFPCAEKKAVVNETEYAVYAKALAESQFGAVLNEGTIPAPATAPRELPRSYRGRIIPDRLYALRKHPDVRLARRVATVAHLARLISERHVKQGLRTTLVVQSQRLEALAAKRLADFADEAPQLLTGDE